MTRILRSHGINAVAVNNDPVPRTLQKFVGDTPFTNPQGIEGDNHKIVTVDCADHARVGEDLKNRFPNIFLNVDHHVSNTKFAEHNFVLSDASATGEILAKFFFDSEFEIDSITAEALYLGICTDTGQFCYSGTNASVFEVCRKLCDAGCNPSNVAHELYEKEKPGRIQLLQKFLASFQMEFDNRVCIGNIREDFYWKQERNLRMQRILLIMLDHWKAWRLEFWWKIETESLKVAFGQRKRNSASICLLKSFPVVAMLVRQGSMSILPSMSFTLPWFPPSVSI